MADKKTTTKTNTKSSTQKPATKSNSQKATTTRQKSSGEIRTLELNKASFYTIGAVAILYLIASI